ncbi:unnamed protein product [Ranitomeya imitator]|uniref:PiggyBac transposable element-derived protein domain-containing protein n=1 Tax=Ranitomeya imitator TaxID=111125 RepID=A0ABN9MIF3_9NEOB|nr:unnamed protein product [Ranitomeya imitator]
MGIVKKPELRQYWSTDILYQTPIYGMVMIRKRFEAIHKFLHFRDNTDILPRDDPNFDRLFKIRPVIEHFSNKFAEVYIPQREICVDESLIHFKGRLQFRQYLPSKRASWKEVALEPLKSPPCEEISPRCNLKDKKNKLDYAHPGAVPVRSSRWASQVRCLPSACDDVLFLTSVTAPAQAYFICPVEGRAKADKVHWSWSRSVKTRRGLHGKKIDRRHRTCDAHQTGTEPDRPWQEDLADEAFLIRHQKYEQIEKVRWSFWEQRKCPKRSRYRYTKRFTNDHDQRYDLAVIVAFTMVTRVNIGLLSVALHLVTRYLPWLPVNTSLDRRHTRRFSDDSGSSSHSSGQCPGNMFSCTKENYSPNSMSPVSWDTPPLNGWASQNFQFTDDFQQVKVLNVLQLFKARTARPCASINSNMCFAPVWLCMFVFRDPAEKPLEYRHLRLNTGSVEYFL